MKAIGLVRQSRTSDESLSPTEQRQRIESVCERENLELVEIHEEIDVSGGTPLADRVGLKAAVEAIEAGEAQVVVVAYFDRLFRSLTVQAEVVSRVESAGGRILAADIGEVSEATPSQWISGTMLGVVAEYYRRSIRERSWAGQVLAVERGHLPYPKVPVGYRRSAEGPLVRDGSAADAVTKAFEMRASGATLADIRKFLATKGIEKSYPGIQSMLKSRVYRGEIHFGATSNLTAHEPLVDEATWGIVQATKVKRKMRSNRLLSGLRILRCATCGTTLSVLHQGKYTVYRCWHPDCPKTVSIKAQLVEDFIVEAVKGRNRELVGTAAMEDDAARAEVLATRAQADLEAAIAAFAGLETEPAAVQKIRELRDRRDEAVEQAGHLRSRSRILTVSMEDWERFSVEAQRGIIRDTLEAAVVGRGRGLGRVSLKFLGQ